MNLTNVIYVYITCVLCIYLVKPKSLFTREGNIKQFGVGYCKNNKDKKTLFHLNIVMILLIFILFLTGM